MELIGALLSGLFSRGLPLLVFICFCLSCAYTGSLLYTSSCSIISVWALCLHTV